MAEHISVGSVYADVVPNAESFASKLKAQVDPQAKSFGESIGKRLADQISKSIRDGLGDGFKEQAPRSKEQGKKQGQDFGGSFAREARTRIEAALRSLPEAKIGVATTEAEQKLKDLRAEMEALSKKEIGVDISDTEALAKIDELKFRLDRLAAESPSVQVKVDAAAAISQLAVVNELVNRVDRTAKVKVEADTSQAESRLARLRSGFSNLGGSGFGGIGTLAMTLGPAAVPLGAGLLGGLGFGLPLAAAGGGALVGGLLAKAAVTRTNAQLKQVEALRKKMIAAEQAAANAGASSTAGNSSAAASTTAANQSAAAHRAAQLQIGAAEAAVARARTPAARQAAEQRVATAQASLANREATISASLSARQSTIAASAAAKQAAAQRKVAEATQAYKAALAGLSPAQLKYKNSLADMKGAFDRLIHTAGPSLLGPVTQGMNLLSKAMPTVAPLLAGVSKGITTLETDVSKFVTSSGFKGFIATFGADAQKYIVDFGRALENIATGAAGFFQAFSPLSGGLMSGLDTLTKKFATWGQNLSGSQSFQHFLEYIKENGPKVGEFLGGAVGAIGKIISGLAPLGGAVLDGLNGVLHFIQTAKPATISAIAISVGALALAFGKGPLGLVTALAAVATHSPAVLSFLQGAGKVVGQLATSFGKLPGWVQEAAAISLGVGVVGKKLGVFGLIGGGKGDGGLGGKAAGGLIGMFSKKSPVPVLVMNPGFGGMGAGGAAAGEGALAASGLSVLTIGSLIVGTMTAGYLIEKHTPVGKWATNNVPEADPIGSPWNGHPGIQMPGITRWLVGKGPKKLAGQVAGKTAGALGTVGSQVVGAAGTAAGWLLNVGKDVGVVKAVKLDAINDKAKETNRLVGLQHDAWLKVRDSVDQGEISADRLRGSVIDLGKRIGADKTQADLLAAALRNAGSIYAGLPKGIVAQAVANHQNKFDRMAGLPHGATGAIVNRPTVALIGESGREAVIPLDRTPGNQPLPTGVRGGHAFNHYGDVRFNDQAEWMRWQQSRSIHAGGGGVVWP